MGRRGQGLAGVTSEDARELEGEQRWSGRKGGGDGKERSEEPLWVRSAVSHERH